MNECLESVEKEMETSTHCCEQIESDERRRLKEFVAKKWHDDL